MKQIFIWCCLFSLFLLLHPAEPDEQHVRDSLLEFLSKLSNANPIPAWNSSSYPCKDNWKGITCDQQSNVQAIALDSSNFSGVFDASTLCNTRSLSSSLLVIDITNNSLTGHNFQDIQDCFQLTELFIGSNNFSGNLPDSISKLKNLQILDISHNQISGPFPDLSQMSGLAVFRAQENQFSGHVPNLDFSRLSELNVSYNNLTGSVPVTARRFNATSFMHNPYLCGPPLPNECTSILLASDDAPPLPQSKHEKRGILDDQFLMYAGYVLIVLVILSVILVCIFKRGKKKVNADKKVASMMSKPSFSTVELKGNETEVSKTDYSSAESGIVSSSLIVLTGPDGSGLRFDDLLKAPAELIGRGNHGSVYKVVCKSQGKTLAVKRIRDWTISSSLFRQRMRRLNQVKHPNVLPVIAYYASKQEKLLVYEYQQYGSLFRLIHAPAGNQKLDWSIRLSYAATIADALAYMHEELQYDRIPHGNLKSSNILINNNMDPCISEYGVTLVQTDQEHSSILANSDLEAAQDDYKAIFKTDTYAYGVILLELLTGRAVLAEGLDLATWVVAVVTEEWTVEVFDKNMVRDGINEETMISALQMAIKCVSKSPEARPSMKEVAMKIKVIREDDERCRSIDVSHDISMSMTRSFIDL